MPLSRIKPRYSPWKEGKRHYKKTSNKEVDSALSPTELHVGQRVCVFTDEGREHGKVLYCGKPKSAEIEMVGIELVRTMLSKNLDDTTKNVASCFAAG